jgi:hypothetical protein
MPNTPTSSGFTLLDFIEKRHGRYLGKAIFRMPSGAVREIDVYRDEFDSWDDALSVRNVNHEIQVAMRCALREARPELNLDEGEGAGQ